MKTRHIIATLAITAPLLCAAEVIHINTATTSMVLDAEKGRPLDFIYYGDKLSDTDVDALMLTAPQRHEAYPVYGMTSLRETAMSATHPDGNMTLQMQVNGVDRYTETDGAEVTAVKMTDTHYPFDITVKYRTYPDAEVIENWVEATNRDRGTVRLTEFASSYMPVRYGNVWLSQLYGSWANEGKLDESPLLHGMKVIKNKDGARNSHTAHGEIMLSLDGKPAENSGRVIGAAICYPGNYRLRIDTDDSQYHHFFAGINEDNAAYNLKKGETLVTPPVAYTYSGEGKSGVSRNYHKWARNHRLHNGNQPRKILLNSWEGVYFDINEEGMAQMMADIASMGGELFVMDDGWFGVKYPRNNDSSSLGDWSVDTRKLPHGIQGLIDTAKENGIKFGIWIEPEMTNSISELYEQHPEYIIKPTNRTPVQGRGGTQLVLDLSNPKVQDLVYNIVDTLMTNYPELDYIKWDANAPFMNHGSQYLPADDQSHLNIEYVRGLQKTLDRIRAKYPDITIQACASGGGRANYGILPWFDEFWVSDNTDALQRVYMQWGTSHFFPAAAMASHISAAPNHQTFRTIPLKYRIDVAMSGRLGMEIQPKNMTDDEKALCRNAIAEYKEIRQVVQQGDIYRLISPYDGKGIASMMYVDPDKDDAVFYWWKTETFCNEQLPRVTMAGLDPDKTYTIHELNRIDNHPLPFEGKSFSGRYLMSNGLEIPYQHDVDYHKRTDYASRVLRLQANGGSEASQTASPFVTVGDDGNFHIGDSVYRFVGTNFWYGAILASEGRGGDRQRLARELDLMQANGIDNVRVLVGGDGEEGVPSHIMPVLQTAPGVYNDTILDGLDYLMADLERRGMKAVLFLNNAWEWSGGYGTYLDWAGVGKTPNPAIDGYQAYMDHVANFVTNDSAKALAADHVRNIVSRTNRYTGRPYSQSPALMTWEIANEPRAFASDPATKEAFHDWIISTAALIKSIDPNHLVSTGSEGKHGCEQDLDLWARIHNAPEIDYGIIHLWPYNWSWISDSTITDNVQSALEKTVDYIGQHAKVTDKPIVLEEFGYPRDNKSFSPGSPTTGRDAFYEGVFNLVNSSGIIAGCNIWGWGGYANPAHERWQPWDDYTCDPAQEEQGLNSVFAADTSTLEIIKNASK